MDALAGETYDFEVEVTCSDADCGDVAVGIDMIRDLVPGKFRLEGELTLEDRDCILHHDNDDMDSAMLWTDLTGKICSENDESTSEADWFTWERDGDEDMVEDYLPDRPDGMGDYARPVPLPVSGQTIWFDWENELIIWDGGDATFDDVGIVDDGDMDDYHNDFYFISDAVSQIHAGSRTGGIARLLTFNFGANTVTGAAATVFDPDSWWGTEEDAFGHVLYTVNDRVFYYVGSGVFRLGGTIGDPNGVFEDYTVTEWADPDQPGLDFFMRVDEEGYLWFGDWGHDNGGYFNCGDDEYLGVGKTNILYGTEVAHQLDFTVDGDNPTVVSLTGGQTLTVTFHLTFEGDEGDYSDFFAYAEMLDYPTFPEAESDTVEVTLVGGGQGGGDDDGGGNGPITFATYTGPGIGIPGGEEGGQEGGETEEGAGEPTIEVIGGDTVGEGLQVIVTGADGNPAGGTVTVTGPDGSSQQFALTDGVLNFTPDKPGTWTFTYMDANGKSVTKTITVAAAPEEPVPLQPEEEPVVTGPTGGQPDNTWLYLLGGLVLVGFGALLFLRKSGRI